MPVSFFLFAIDLSFGRVSDVGDAPAARGCRMWRARYKLPLNSFLREMDAKHVPFLYVVIRVVRQEREDMTLCSALCLRRARSESLTFGKVGKNCKSAHCR